MLQIKPNKPQSRPEWLVENRYTFGTGTDNDFIVRGQDVHSFQAALEVDGDIVTLFNMGGGESIKVNGSVIEAQIPLSPGDEFNIGESGFTLADPKQGRIAANSAATDAEAAKAWTLKAQNTALANKVYELSGSKVIGRSQECDICLYVVHLSRKHARLTVKGDQIEVEDLSSSNGTYINGVKIQRSLARSGDEIAFDTLRFTLMGPNQNLENTQIRPATQSDATTMRPALSPQQLAEFAEKKRVPPKKPRTYIKPSPAAEITKTDHPKDVEKVTTTEIESNNLVGIVLVAIIVVIVAVAYFYAG